MLPALKVPPEIVAPLIVPVVVKLPVTVRTVAPAFWLKIELAMVLVPVNIAIVFAVPLVLVVTPPPLPAQFPELKQIVGVPVPGSGKV